VKKTTLALILIACLLAAGVAWAVNEYVLQHQIDQSATVASMEVYIDDVLNLNSLDWSPVVAGESYYVNLTVKNTGTTEYNVTLILENFPVGWTQTWENITDSVNGTILQPGQQVCGNLTLTVPSGVTEGTYSWISYVEAQQT